MAMTVTCDDCGSTFRVKDSAQGRKVRCKTCGAAVHVPVGGQPQSGHAPQMPPRVSGAKRKRSTGKMKTTNSRSGPPIVLLIGGGVVLFVFLAVGGFFVVYSLLPGANDGAVATVGASAEDDQATTVEASQEVAVQPVREPGPEPIMIDPAPEDEMRELEAITADVIATRIREMEKEELESTGGNEGVNIAFDEVNLYTDAASSFTVTESVTRTITENGESSVSSWQFEQTIPLYVGAFVAGNFVDPRESGQAARFDTGSKSRAGIWSLYYEDGSPRGRGQYENGQRHGWFTFWHPDGRRRWQGLYSEDRLEESLTFTADQQSMFGEAAILVGHKAPIMSVAFSVDGSRIATGDFSGEIRVWDMESFEELFRTHVEHAVTQLAFSPAGETLAVGLTSLEDAGADEPGSVAFWDLTGATAPETVGACPLLSDMFFSLDGRTLITAPKSGSLLAWDVESRSQRNEPLGSGAFAVFHNGERVAVQRDDRIVLLDGNDFRVLGMTDPLRFRVGPRQMVLGENGQVLFAITSDGPFYWDFERGVAMPASPHLAATVEAGSANHIVTRETQHTDQFKELFEDYGDAFAIWSFQNGSLESVIFEPKELLEQHVVGGVVMSSPVIRQSDDLMGFLFGPNGENLAAKMDRQDGTAYAGYNVLGISLWNVQEARHHVLRGHTAHIEAMRFSSDGSFLATAGSDMSCILWDLQRLHGQSAANTAVDNRAPLLTLDVHQVQGLLESEMLTATLNADDPDGDELRYQFRLGSDSDWRPAWEGRIVILSAPAGDLELQARVVDEHGTEATDTTTIHVTANPYSRWALSHQANFGLGEYDRLAVSSNGSIAALYRTGRSLTWTLELWRMPGFDSVRLADGFTLNDGSGVMAFSPDGETLAVPAIDGSFNLTLFDAETGQRSDVLVGHTELVEGAAFSHNGQFLYSLSQSELRTWSTKDGTMLGELGISGRRPGISSLTVSPDGQYLLTGANHIREITTGKEVEGYLGFTFAFHPDGKKLVLLARDEIQFWQFPRDSENPTRILEDIEGEGSLAVSPDGAVLVTHEKGNLVFRRLSDGRALSELPLRVGNTPAFAFSPDGSSLVSLDPIGGLRVWSEP